MGWKRDGGQGAITACLCFRVSPVLHWGIALPSLTVSTPSLLFCTLTQHPLPPSPETQAGGPQGALKGVASEAPNAGLLLEVTALATKRPPSNVLVRRQRVHFTKNHSEQWPKAELEGREGGWMDTQMYSWMDGPMERQVKTDRPAHLMPC